MKHFTTIHGSHVWKKKNSIPKIGSRIRICNETDNYKYLNGMTGIVTSHTNWYTCSLDNESSEIFKRCMVLLDKDKNMIDKYQKY